MGYPFFETNEERDYLLVTLPVHTGFLEFDTKSIDITGTALRVLQACNDAPMSTMQIAVSLKVSPNSGGLKKTLNRLLELGLLAYTVPDKPNSRSQKYLLTSKGEQTLNRNTTLNKA